MTFPPSLNRLVDDAADALFSEALSSMPLAGPDLVAWCRALAGESPPSGYFLHARAFPSVHLGEWALEATGDRVLGLRMDLIRSTVAGYYFIRLIDEVTDDGSATATGLLPLAGFLHHAFERPYHSRFPHGHAFWTDFGRLWASSAEASTADLSLDAIDGSRFAEVSAKKVIGALIPVSAVFRAHGASVPAGWTALVEQLAQYHQLSNDLAGWPGDLAAGRSTWLLSAGRASGAPTILDWLLDGGLDWTQEQRAARFREVAAAATPLGSPGLLAWILQRAEDDRATNVAIRSGLRALTKLRLAMRPQS